jgi:hypothetical protein
MLPQLMYLYRVPSDTPIAFAASTFDSFAGCSKVLSLPLCAGAASSDCPEGLSFVLFFTSLCSGCSGSGGGIPSGPAPGPGAFCFRSSSGMGRLGVLSTIICQESPIIQGNLYPHNTNNALINQVFLFFTERRETATGECRKFPCQIAHDTSFMVLSPGALALQHHDNCPEGL